MQHHSEDALSPVQNVYDVVAYCRAKEIDEDEIARLVLLVGRFASRLEIQMNLKNPPRFR